MTAFTFDAILVGIMCFPIYHIVNRGSWKNCTPAIIATAAIVSTAYLALRLTVLPVA